MKKKVLAIVIIAVAGVALVVGAFILYRKLSAENTVENDVVLETDPVQSTRHARDFLFYDSDGGEHYLSEYYGKPVILNFWASWCGPCQMEMPFFEEAYKEYSDSITFLMVNLTDGSRETQKIAEEFIEKNEYTFPVGFDKDGQGVKAYSIYYIPDTYFIDSDGNIVSYAEGSISQDTLDKNIALLME